MPKTKLEVQVDVSILSTVQKRKSNRFIGHLSFSFALLKVLPVKIV